MRSPLYLYVVPQNRQLCAKIKRKMKSVNAMKQWKGEMKLFLYILSQCVRVDDFSRFADRKISVNIICRHKHGQPLFVDESLKGESVIFSLISHKFREMTFSAKVKYKLRCFLYDVFDTNSVWQISQTYLCSRCTALCALKLCGLLNFLGQSGHWNTAVSLFGLWI